MPNPFPGMNPYLENSLRWPNAHFRMIAYIADALNEIMPPDYVAAIQERCRIVSSERIVYPDVLLRRERPILPDGASATAVLPPEIADAPSDVPLVFEALPFEPRETYVDILLAGTSERIVTSIELLSPDNKRAGESQEAYLAKQRETLVSRTHLVEIDLLRAGAPTVAVTRLGGQESPRRDYTVCLHRAETGSRFEVWPVTIRQALPRITVPLLEADPDVTLDLQRLVNHCYDAGRFARQLDYAQEPNPPLTTDDALWADALLRERGLRS